MIAGPIPGIGETMANPLDHFMWAAADLDAAVAAFERLSGVRAGIGGSHPGRGTRNALASLGPDVYLELIAPDPAQPLPGTPGGELLRLTRPCLNAFVAASRDLPAVQKAYAGCGVETDLLDGGRKTPTGGFVRWKVLIPRGNDFGAFAPLFIDWLDSIHPAQVSTAGCRLAKFEVGHPDADRIATLWRALDLAVPLVRADHPCFGADLATPRGPLRLTSAMA